ncbi:MAG: hypothetical protein SFY69_03815 [Planctomycetota bacterium]|nr:hypothetical protein [Planctomycetota bacterium]
MAAALRLAADTARSAGRVIIEVKADGERLSDESLGAPSEDAAPIGVLAFTSADPRRLVGQTLLDAVEALEQARGDQQATAELIQSGDTDRAMDPLSRVLGTWQAVGEVVDRGATLLSLDVSTLRLEGVEEGESFAHATSALREHLRLLRDAVRDEDWSGVSDILAYDLDAQAERWAYLMRALARHVSSDAG